MKSGSDIPDSAETDETSETESAEHAHEGGRGELAEAKDAGKSSRGAGDLADGLLPGRDLLRGLLDLGGSLMSAMSAEPSLQLWGEQQGREAQRGGARARAAGGP